MDSVKTDQIIDGFILFTIFHIYSHPDEMDVVHKQLALSKTIE